LEPVCSEEGMFEADILRKGLENLERKLSKKKSLEKTMVIVAHWIQRGKEYLF